MILILKSYIRYISYTLSVTIYDKKGFDMKITRDSTDQKGEKIFQVRSKSQLYVMGCLVHNINFLAICTP